MKLNEALEQIAKHAGISAKSLIAFAKEDKITGCEDGEFSSISVSRNEGKIIYALVRALRPELAVEIGTHSGCSATHILAAMEANGVGHLHSIDIGGIQPPGIPAEFHRRWSIDEIDARYYNWPEQVDFVLEDGDHTRDLTSRVVAAAKAHGARAILAHDAYNASVGGEVCAGFADAAPDYGTVLVDGPALGLAYWFREVSNES